MFTISTDVLVTTKKLSRPVGVFVVLVVEVVSNGLGGCKDATINEGVGWSIKEEKT